MKAQSQVQPECKAQLISSKVAQAVGVPPQGTQLQPSSQAIAVARSAQAVGVPLQLAPLVQP